MESGDGRQKIILSGKDMSLMISNTDTGEWFGQMAHTILGCMI